MTLTVLLQVPPQDAADLEEILRFGPANQQLTTAQPFDGEAAIQAILTVTGSTLPALGAWLLARVRIRKNFRIVTNGTELTGYTVEEAQAILDHLKRLLDEVGDDESSPSDADD